MEHYDAHLYMSTTLHLIILMASFGRSSASTATEPNLSTTPIPANTRPNIVCFPFNDGVGASEMKN
jgi:hypothetical protein